MVPQSYHCFEPDKISSLFSIGSTQLPSVGNQKYIHATDENVIGTGRSLDISILFITVLLENKIPSIIFCFLLGHHYRQ